MSRTTVAPTQYNFGWSSPKDADIFKACNKTLNPTVFSFPHIATPTDQRQTRTHKWHFASYSPRSYSQPELRIASECSARHCQRRTTNYFSISRFETSVIYLTKTNRCAILNKRPRASFSHPPCPTQHPHKEITYINQSPSQNHNVFRRGRNYRKAKQTYTVFNMIIDL